MKVVSRTGGNPWICPPLVWIKTLWWRVKQTWRALRFTRQVGQVRRQLAEWAGGERVWVFAPGLSWQKQLFQRPQQLARALAGLGEKIVYLEPDWSWQGAPELLEMEANLRLCCAPPQALAGLEDPFLYLLPWSYSPAFALQRSRLIYDIVDDFSTFRQVHPCLLAHQHRERIARAEVVLVTARRLEETFRTERADLILCPNGADVAFFSQPPGRLAPEIEELRREGKPIIGYIGALAEWFDDELLEAVARLRADLSFMVIGPELHPRPGKRPWQTLPNVRWLDARPYESLPAYLHGFHAVMIPFRLTPITHATSPLKLFEAMAAGKPVVLTPMEESLSVPMVFPADTPQAWSDQLDRALASAVQPGFREALRQEAARHSWQNRARQILAAVERSSMRMV